MKTLFETVKNLVKAEITQNNVGKRLAYVEGVLGDKELGGKLVSSKNLSILRKAQKIGPQVWILDPVYRTKRGEYDMEKVKQILVEAKDAFAKQIAKK